MFDTEKKNNDNNNNNKTQTTDNESQKREERRERDKNRKPGKYLENASIFLVRPMKYFNEMYDCCSLGFTSSVNARSATNLFFLLWWCTCRVFEV